MVSAGGVTATDYEPYGQPLGNGTVTGARKGFIDKELDRETGDDNTGVRSLDSRRGSFTSVDPLWEQSRDLSPYHYGANNPMRYIDNTGLDTVSTSIATEPGQNRTWQTIKGGGTVIGGILGIVGGVLLVATGGGHQPEYPRLSAAWEWSAQASLALEEEQQFL